MPKPFRPRKKGKQPSKSLYTPAYDRIREILRDTRYAAGLSQEELGVRLGRKQIYVSRCESGERRVDLLEWLDPHGIIDQILPMVSLPRSDDQKEKSG